MDDLKRWFDGTDIIGVTAVALTLGSIVVTSSRKYWAGRRANIRIDIIDGGHPVYRLLVRNEGEASATAVSASEIRPVDGNEKVDTDLSFFPFELMAKGDFVSTAIAFHSRRIACKLKVSWTDPRGYHEEERTVTPSGRVKNY